MASSVTAGVAVWGKTQALNKVGAYSLRPDAGAYHYVTYNSDRDDAHLHGYTANIKRTGGSRYVVGAQLNGYSLDPTGSSAAPVFGIACEAWTGDHTTEPNVPAILKPLETSVISQRHDNDKALWGLDIVFKNRRDGGSVLRGNIGSNAFNRNSAAIIVSSQARSPLGEYCGWNRGIVFKANSLDRSVDGAPVAIDMSEIDANKMRVGVLMANGVAIGMSGGASSGAQIELRYLDSNGRIQFRDGGITPVELIVRGGGAAHGLAVNGNKVVGMQGAAIADAAAGTEVTTINAILASLRAHGLIAT